MSRGSSVLLGATLQFIGTILIAFLLASCCQTARGQEPPVVRAGEARHFVVMNDGLRVAVIGKMLSNGQLRWEQTDPRNVESVTAARAMARIVKLRGPATLPSPTGAADYESASPALPGDPFPGGVSLPVEKHEVIRADGPAAMRWASDLKTDNELDKRVQPENRGPARLCVTVVGTEEEDRKSVV